MPSNASDIYRPYVAGKLQWPIHRDTSVCRLFRGFGMIEFGREIATVRSPRAAEAFRITGRRQKVALSHTFQKFYSVKTAFHS
jgi:hypothetical protein